MDKQNTIEKIRKDFAAIVRKEEERFYSFLIWEPTEFQGFACKYKNSNAKQTNKNG